MTCHLAYTINGLPDAKMQAVSSAERVVCSLTHCLNAALTQRRIGGMLPSSGTITECITNELRAHNVPESRARLWSAGLDLTPISGPICTTLAGRTLDPYQSDALRRLTCAGGVLALGCGLGKTLTALCAVESFSSQLSARRLWIVAPLNAIGSWRPYISHFTDAGWDVKLVSMDSLHKLAAAPIGGIVIYDECFPAGTMVATTAGPRDIRDLVNRKESALVYTSKGVAKITGWLKKPSSQKMLAIHHSLGVLKCTANHPIFTKENGYVRADQLRPDHHTLRALRGQSNQTPEDRDTPKVLRPGVRRRVSTWTPASKPQGRRTYASSQSYVDAWRKRTRHDCARPRSVLRTRWEWTRLSRRRAISRDVSTNKMESCYRGKELPRLRSSSLLQSRLCYPETQTRHRNRRRIPSFIGSTGSRQEEGADSRIIRVEDITNTERGGNGGSRSHESDGNYVYCLETTHGEFYADNILVHNCHLLGSAGARRTKAAHSTRGAFDVGLCLTGTFLHGGVEKTLSMLDLAVPGAAGFASKWSAGEYFRCLVRKTVGTRRVTELCKPAGASRDILFRYLSRYVVMLSSSSESVRASLTVPDQHIHTIQLAEPWRSLHEEAAHVALTEHAETGVLPNAQATAHALCRANAEAKVDWLLEHLGDEPCVVYAHYHETLDTVCHALTDADISWVRVDGSTSATERISARDSFAHGDVQVFVGQVVASGIGVDGLQERAIYSVSLDHSWRPDVYSQSLARTCRRGQTRETHHFDLVANRLQERVLCRIRSGEQFNAECEEWQEIRQNLSGISCSASSGTETCQNPIDADADQDAEIGRTGK